MTSQRKARASKSLAQRSKRPSSDLEGLFNALRGRKWFSGNLLTNVKSYQNTHLSHKSPWHPENYEYLPPSARTCCHSDTSDMPIQCTSPRTTPERDSPLPVFGLNWAATSPLICQTIIDVKHACSHHSVMIACSKYLRHAGLHVTSGPSGSDTNSVGETRNAKSGGQP